MSISYPLISVNGVFGAQISPLDRGFAYGDGLFETCLIRNAQIPLWDFHCDRLLEGCKRLQLPIDYAELLVYREQLLNACDLQEGVLKIMITRGAGGRGYRLPESVVLTYCLVVFPLMVASAHKQGVNVCVCQQVLANTPSLAGLKHLNRLEYILARSEWQGDDYAEGLLLNESGNLIEATASNVFLVRDGKLLTPELRLAGVAGVMRSLIVQKLAPAMGISVVVASLTLSDLELADEIFVCNSIVGIWPVLTVAGVNRLEFSLGVITQALQQSLEVYLASCSRQSSVIR